MAPLPSSPTPSPGQALVHQSSVPSPLSLRHTSLPSESHTNNLAASAHADSVLDTTISTHKGYSFLSLPPEIRNMIYHYIFPPVRDGTCWRIYTDWDRTRLKGIRTQCLPCRSGLTHTTCCAEYEVMKDMFSSFEISGYFARPGILQTCNTVLNEALPVLLASMHINMTCYYMDMERRLGGLKLLLTYMRQPTGAYLSVFTGTYHDKPYDGGHGIRDFGQLMNRANIRVGHLILCVDPDGAYRHFVRRLIATLEHLDHKPMKLEWTCLSRRTSHKYANQRAEFNAAAGGWLAELAKVKAPNARLPLLRDFLPQFFKNTSDSADLVVLD